jgi:hypothetical protein
MMAHENYDQAFKILFRYSDRATSKYFRALQQLEKMQRARRRDEERTNREPRRAPQIAALPGQEPGLGSFGETAGITWPAGAAAAAPEPIAPAAAEGPGLGSFGATAAVTPVAAHNSDNDTSSDDCPALALVPALCNAKPPEHQTGWRFPLDGRKSEGARHFGHG